MSRANQTDGSSPDSLNIKNLPKFDNGAGVNANEISYPVPHGVQTPALTFLNQPEAANSPSQGDPAYLNYGGEYENDAPIMMGSPMAPMFVQIMKDTEEEEKNAVKRRNLIIIISVAIFMLFLPSILSITADSGQGKSNGAAPFGVQKHHTIITDSNVTFKDIHGCEDVKKELQKVVEFLTKPEKFAKSGAKMPHGYLLAGPPGVGKTMLAKALAGEANVPFITIAGSEFNEMFVGVGVSRVRALFADARAFGKAIIFIDEIDALAMKRNSSFADSANSERASTLNQLLIEMDGFKTQDGIFVLAATNTPEALDDAIKREGRFGKTFNLKPPNKAGRLSHLKAKLTGENISEELKNEVNLKRLVEKTKGYTGAQMDSLINRAKSDFSNNEDTADAKLSMKHFLSAFNFFENVDSNNKPLTQFEKERIAYGEAGLEFVKTYYKNEKIELNNLFQSKTSVRDNVDVDIGEDDDEQVSILTIYDAEVLLDTYLAKSVAEEIYLKDANTKKKLNNFEPKKHVLLSSSGNLTRAREIAQIMLKHMNDNSWFIAKTDASLIVESQRRVETILTDNKNKSEWKKIADKLLDNNIG